MKYTAKGFVATLLLLLIAWLYFLARKVPQEVKGELGISLIFFGILDLLLSKKNSSIVLGWTGAKVSKAARLWESLGKSAVEFFFLGIGVVLVGAGIIFLVC